MRVSEIFEAMSSPRREFEQKLEDNKQELQQPKTRMGVIKVLKQIFPDVEFKMFGGKGEAKYEPSTRTITVYNTNNLMTGKNVRDNWGDFASTMSTLLTHEHMHKEQAKRRGYKHDDITPSADKKTRKEFFSQFERLQQSYAAYQQLGKQEEAAKIFKQIQKLQRRAKSQGVHLANTRQQYFSSRDEVTAYAETVANKVVKMYNGDKKQAIQAIQSKPDQLQIPELQNYYLHVGKDSKTMKQLFKQVVAFIQES